MPPRTSTGWSIEAMVFTTPSTAATIPSAGMRVGDGLQRGRAGVQLGMVLLELPLHALLDLVGVVHAHGHHAQRVGHEVEREMVVLDAREAAEQGALVRVLEVRLERQRRPWSSGA